MSPDPVLVRALAASVLPQGLAIAVRDPRLMPQDADPEEGAALKAAVPRRVAEFHAGRAAARAAMSELGLLPRPVPMGPDRAPIWPEGVAGSISHTAQVCVAAVGRSADWAGIGIDLEPAEPLDPLLVGEICNRAERTWLGTQPAAERGLMAKLIFSAKEAAYKAQYPVSRKLFGFDVIEVRLDRENSRFTAEFKVEQGPFAVGSTLRGAYAHAAGVLVTGVALVQARGRETEWNPGQDLGQSTVPQEGS